MTEPVVPIDVDLSGDDLTMNEKIVVEDLCGGRPFFTLRAEGGMRFFRAVAWVMLRRSQPGLSLEDAGELKVQADGG